MNDQKNKHQHKSSNGELTGARHNKYSSLSSRSLSSKPSARIATITEDNAGQRIDNFLITELKGVPKTRIYRAIRGGEVRVNSGRIKQTYKLQLGDKVRVPPIARIENENSKSNFKTKGTNFAASKSGLDFIEKSIIYEDDSLMVVDKPANLPVHGGTGVSGGLIERMAMLRPQCKFLNLAHRLDRATSGCIIIAKKRAALLQIQEQLVQRSAFKQYLCLVKGNWEGDSRRVTLPLRKNILARGERRVIVADDGKPAETLFRPLCRFNGATLLDVRLKTGRTHQIRVHAAASGFPVAGDEKYGDEDFNKYMCGLGLRRLFLHSAGISLKLEKNHWVGICSPLDGVLRGVLRQLQEI